MPHVVAYAVNTNDVMHALRDTCAPASWPSLGYYYAPKITCIPAICASQMTSTQIYCFTFLNPKS